MHRSIAGYNPYNLFILTKDYSKNFTTNKVLTIGHMLMFVVKSINIQINGLAYGSINCRVILHTNKRAVYYPSTRQKGYFQNQFLPFLYLHFALVVQ